MKTLATKTLTLSDLWAGPERLEVTLDVRDGNVGICSNWDTARTFDEVGGLVRSLAPDDVMRDDIWDVTGMKGIGDRRVTVTVKSPDGAVGRIVAGSEEVIDGHGRRVAKMTSDALAAFDTVEVDVEQVEAEGWCDACGTVRWADDLEHDPEWPDAEWLGDVFAADADGNPDPDGRPFESLIHGCVECVADDDDWVVPTHADA